MQRLIGILENNGSFVVNIIKNNKYSSGYSVALNFTFRSTEEDLLEHVKVLLGNKGVESKVKKDILIIVGTENLKQFAKILDMSGNFISFKRQKEFLAFKEIVNMYGNKLHLTKEGIIKIKDKKKEICR